MNIFFRIVFPIGQGAIAAENVSRGEWLLADFWVIVAMLFLVWSAWERWKPHA